jgi:hypothetical protein
MKTYGKVTTIVAAVAALAVSGIALAEPDPDRVPSKDKPKGSPGDAKSKSSIEVVNTCEPAFENEAGVPGDYLKVTSKITNESEEIVVVDEIIVDGFQFVPDSTDSEGRGKKPKKVWKLVGHTEYPGSPAPSFEIPVDPEGDDAVFYEVYINLCQQPTLGTEAVALNVTSEIVVDNRSFFNNCDDPYPDDEIDQSRIDLEELEPPLDCFDGQPPFPE